MFRKHTICSNDLKHNVLKRLDKRFEPLYLEEEVGSCEVGKILWCINRLLIGLEKANSANFRIKINWIQLTLDNSSPHGKLKLARNIKCSSKKY